MALVPLNQWKLDKDGRPKLDGKGKKIPHQNIGQRKADRDWTDQERRKFDDAVAFDVSARRRRAGQIVAKIRDAEAVISNS